MWASDFSCHSYCLIFNINIYGWILECEEAAYGLWVLRALGRKLKSLCAQAKYQVFSYREDSRRWNKNLPHSFPSWQKWWCLAGNDPLRIPAVQEPTCTGTARPSLAAGSQQPREAALLASRVAVCAGVKTVHWLMYWGREMSLTRVSLHVAAEEVCPWSGTHTSQSEPTAGKQVS